MNPIEIQVTPTLIHRLKMLGYIIAMLLMIIWIPKIMKVLFAWG